MIILDTNVVSEQMLAHPSPAVMAWLDQIDYSLLWLTAITVYEIQYGIERLPAGRRKQQLATGFDRMLRQLYRHRIIEFDVSAAMLTAKLAAKARSRGENMSQRDLAIAGIALQHGAAIATRNVRDFPHEGLEIINPWET